MFIIFSYTYKIFVLPYCIQINLLYICTVIQ
nr:MAG TPA: hypothetical protein [Caudoviricetes sp.]